MAKIWRVYEGREPTQGGPWVDIPLADAIAALDLQQDDFISDLTERPRFGNLDRDFSYAGYKHVIVEIERSEGRRTKWKAGFYRSRVGPRDAFSRLIQQPLMAELGERNVVRVEHEPTTDSQGRDALRITVVIAPGATKRLHGGSALNALIRLRKRLGEMGDERTPMIEYATEAELAQDVGP
jgi:hypothetical protein